MKSLPVIVACALLLAPGRVCVATIVGWDNPGNLGPPIFPGPLFTVDTITGTAAPGPGTVAGSSFVAVSSAPEAGWFFAYSPVNLYSFNAGTGQDLWYACSEFVCSSVHDLAYDFSNGNIYGLGRDYPNAPQSLFRLTQGGRLYPQIPDSRVMSYDWIGELQADIRLIEFIPGLGLYGTDGVSAGFVINETTGRATLLHPLTGVFSPITGLAWSSDTGRLIATSVFPSGPGQIYLLDPVSGSVTLLNDQAPRLIGIADIVPEPQPAWLLACGLAVCIGLRGLFKTRSSRPGVPCW